MAKFSKHEFVKFTEEVRLSNDLTDEILLVIGVTTSNDRETLYDLVSCDDFSKYIYQKEEWLEEVPYQIIPNFFSGGRLDLSESKIAINENKTVSILGTTYTIQTRKVSEDEYMKHKHLCGYCCEESKRIVVADMSEKEYFELDEAEQKSCYKRTLRHELVHAFLNESGLSDDASVPAGSWAKHEEIIDWFAIQSPKIFKTFEELDIL